MLSTGWGTPYSARAGRANSVTLVPRNILWPTQTARTSATDKGLHHRLHGGLDNRVDSVMAGDPPSLSILNDVTKLLQKNANHTHTHADTHTYSSMPVHTYKHSSTHPRTYAHTHTQTNIHTHKSLLTFSLDVLAETEHHDISYGAR